MLYRTTQNHLPSPSSSLSPPPHLHSSTIYSPPSPQGMDLPETKTEGEEDIITTDDMFVDELLDFSTGFSEPDPEPELKTITQVVLKTDEHSSPSPVSVLTEEEQTQIQKVNTALSGKDDFAPLPHTELTPPVQEEGLESLEWLSHFVEDSFSEYSLTGKPPPKPAEKRPEPAVCLQNHYRFPKITKARTKRARTGVRVRPVLSPEYYGSSSSPSSSTSSTTSFPPPNYWAHSQALFIPITQQLERKSPAAEPRRCSHCGVTKTPQWRAGPLGSKTLCNACGVRFKSGRLLPEYRPACSPTFSSELHSNNHRKVLEMRRQKETGVVVPGPVQG